MRNIVIYQWQGKALLRFLLDRLKERNTVPDEIHIFTASDFEIENVKERLNRDSYIHTVQGKTPPERKEYLSRKLKDIIRPQDNVYLNLGNGELQFSQMLVHLCFEKYHGQLVLLLESGRSLDYINAVPMKDKMTELQFYHHVHELLQSGNYQSAKSIIQTRFTNKEINKLLDFAHALFNLELDLPAHSTTDFFSVLENVLKEIDGNEKQIAYVRRMKALRNQGQKEFIFFIYNYAAFLYDTDDLIDFIVLYYRLVEESLLYAIGWNYREEADGTFTFMYRKGSKYALEFPNWPVNRYFHHYLKALKQKIRNIEESYSQVKIRRNKCVGLEKLTEEEQFFVKLYMQFNDKELEDFLDLRHEGVSGHGFADFTKEKFEQLCGGKTPLEKIEPILQDLDLIPEYSLFELTQKAVLGLLRMEMAEESRDRISVRRM